VEEEDEEEKKKEEKEVFSHLQMSPQQEMQV
jgi:hypothetical protein